MKRYNTYLITISILTTILVASYFIYAHSIIGAKTKSFLLFFALISATIILSVKFFYFKNATIAWFVLVLMQLCVIIYLYFKNIVDNSFWPILFFVPAISNIFVFWNGEGVSRFVTGMLIVNGFSAMLYTQGVLPILYAILLGVSLAMIFVGMEKLIIVLKRRYYGKI